LFYCSLMASKDCVVGTFRGEATSVGPQRREYGQKTKNAFPTIFFLGTTPQYLLSELAIELSPRAKYESSGTTKVVSGYARNCESGIFKCP